MLAVPTPAKAARVAESPRWVTAMVLRSLASLAPAAGSTFTQRSLAKAQPDLTPARRQRATAKLVALGFATMQRQLLDGTMQGVYTVTADGAAAIEAAANGAMLMSGQQGPRPPAPGSFRARLWQLVRIRKLLTAEEAVQLLADAGDPRFVSKRNRANEYLRAWAANGVLQVSAKRGTRGQKQYVLVTDPGPAVPTVRKGAAA